jgi:tRNA-splicing ligase RtcB
MKKVISTERIPIKLWLDDIEDSAMEQARNAANLPFTFKHVAICPDAHKGYGLPVGGVMATKGVVVPYAIGVDIGCGICAIKTSLCDTQPHALGDIMGVIRQTIPVGFNHHPQMQDEALMPSPDELSVTELPVVTREYNKARKSLGTLGGGNHFIEIQKDQDKHIWIMIHSGSRNLGKQVCDFYNKIAIELNEMFCSVVDRKQELAFLPFGIPRADAYLREMQYCVDYALANRKLMMDRICDILRSLYTNVFFEPMINIAHNYARMENHAGENVLIHRKGATSARKGEIGIIPGSQGTKSYIVRGLGNPESFMSCSHGAGRRMGRKQAQRSLVLETEKKILDDQGIIHGIRSVKDLDEAVGSYKDIATVMANQSDLVEIVTELTPLGVIKG